MTDTETDNITEQEYILLANDFKLKYDELKRKLFLKNIKIKSLQKELMICLGFSTMFQELYLDLPDNHYLKVMISCYENHMNKFFSDNTYIDSDNEEDEDL